MIPQLAAILEYLDGLVCRDCRDGKVWRGGVEAPHWQEQCPACDGTGKDPEAQRLLAAWRAANHD